MHMGLIWDSYYIWDVCIWEATFQQTDAHGTYVGLMLHVGRGHMGSNVSTDGCIWDLCGTDLTYGTYAYGKQHLNRLMHMGLMWD